MPHTPGSRSPLCPGCGSKGMAVKAVTVHALLPRLSDRPNSNLDAFCFCGSTLCDVVYFSVDGWSAHKGALNVRVGVKETQDPIPVCYCFGYSRDDILADQRRNRSSSISNAIEAAMKASRCSCETKNPSGRCCLTEIHRILGKAHEPDAELAPSGTLGTIRQREMLS